VTLVEFHHDAPDKLGLACLLVGRLFQAGRKAVLFAPDAAIAQRIDHLLWSQPALGFVPHVAAGHRLAAETPVIISARLDDTPHDDVLVNLDGELPPGFARFRQLVEIVGMDDADRLPARQRFKFYRDRGYELRTVRAES
jgi:DNA polymerase-3 subunit chi